MEGTKEKKGITIWISRETWEDMKALKVHPRQTYGDIVAELVEKALKK